MSYHMLWQLTLGHPILKKQDFFLMGQLLATKAYIDCMIYGGDGSKWLVLFRQWYVKHLIWKRCGLHA